MLSSVAHDEQFMAVPSDAGWLERAESLAPTNPFVSRPFVEAQRALGCEPWVVGITTGGSQRLLAVAHVRRGRLRASCEVLSAPPCAETSVFWSGLLDFCRTQHVTDLFVGTSGSPSAAIPELPGEVERVARGEFLLDLEVDDLMSSLSASHRAHVRKAARHGVVLRRTRDPAAVGPHVGLHDNSMQRRRARGEEVPEYTQQRQLEALLAAGSGELFQATRDGDLLGSLLVLRARDGAYFYSSGNSPEGMRCGASHFLTYETALALRTEGNRVFNLGGARPHETGLRDYKTRFGTTLVELQAASFDLSTGFRRVLAGAVDLARRAVARAE